MENQKISQLEYCEICHNHKEDVEFCLNPYDEDVNNEEIWQHICSSCYDTLVDDI